MRHAILASILALLIPAALAAQERPDFSDEVREFIAVDAPAVLLTNVTVVDGTGRQPMPNQAVLIENGRIAQVGTTGDVRAPESAEVLDLQGHTLIPGIVGLHNHTFYTTTNRIAQLSTSAPRLYLASGVTTIRTTGSYQPYAEINLMRAIEIGEEVGPRMHLTGPYITGPGETYYQFMTGVETAEEARRVVAYWAEEGATWFKLFTRINRAAARAVIEEAHSRGLKVTGHLCSLSYTEAVQLGIDNIEHGFFWNTDWDPEKQPDQCPPGALIRLADVDLDSPGVAATIRTMVEAGVPMTSTLAVAETTLPDRPPLEDRVIDVLAPEFAADYLSVREEIAAHAAAAPDESPWIPIWEKALRFERMFHEAGGVLVAGGDPVFMGGTLPGFADQRNYELLLEAGFDPLEAIRIMTLNGAIVLGEDDLYGSIEEGKLSDIVVIEGDPILRPEEIRNVRLVFRDGIGYDPEALIASVRGQVGIR